MKVIRVKNIVRANPVPGNPRRWQVELECGHFKFINSRGVPTEACRCMMCEDVILTELTDRGKKIIENGQQLFDFGKAT